MSLLSGKTYYNESNQGPVNRYVSRDISSSLQGCLSSLSESSSGSLSLFISEHNHSSWHGTMLRAKLN